MIMSRRQALCGAALVALAPVLSRPAAAQGTGYRGGCCLPPLNAARLRQNLHGLVVASPGDIRTVRSSGDPETDRFLGRGLLRIATAFHVDPGFAFYDDHRSPNAFATQVTLQPDRWGTVLMGMRLFSRNMTDDGDNGMTVIAICAHEFGHIYQMQSGDMEPLGRLDRTVRPIELHADFLAGYFLAGRKKEHPDLDLRTVGATFYRIGDTDFNSPQHHGTPQERLAAITEGYRFGRSGSHAIDEAARAGAALVARMM